MKTAIQMLQKLNKKPLDNLSKYVIFCIVFFVLYTITEIIVSTVTGISHDALTEAVRWFTSGEAFLCCLLKLMKIRKSN